MSIDVNEANELRRLIKGREFLKNDSVEFYAGMRYLINLMENNMTYHDAKEYDMQIVRNNIIHNPILVNPFYIRNFVRAEVQNLKEGKRPKGIIIENGDARASYCVYDCFTQIPYSGKPYEAVVNMSTYVDYDFDATIEKYCYKYLAFYQKNLSRFKDNALESLNQKAAIEYIIACISEICMQLVQVGRASVDVDVLESKIKKIRNKIVHGMHVIALPKEEASESMRFISDTDFTKRNFTNARL